LKDTLNCIFPSDNIEENKEDKEVEVIGFNKKRIREFKENIKKIIEKNQSMCKGKIKFSDIVKPNFWKSGGKNKFFKVRNGLTVAFRTD
jgi:HD superfamily phosphohydrolase YqeK